MSKRGPGKRRGGENQRGRGRPRSESRIRRSDAPPPRNSKTIVCGINVMNQLMATAPERILEVYMLEDLGRERRSRLDKDPRELGVAVTTCDLDELYRLTGSEQHQGIAAHIKPLPVLDDNGALELLAGISEPLILILDSIQDPRNFGACLRTAESAGVDLVVVPRSRSVEMTPVVSKVASGAAEVQPVARVSNLARFMRELQESGVHLVGTDGEGQGNLYAHDLTGPLAIVMGAEGEGMRRLTREHCDITVKLPMRGTVESLNLSVATGVCLYEVLRQRGV